jgi:hypothetical protein
MRILLTAAIAASLAAGSMSALAQTAAPTPAKQKACKTLKGEDACTKERTDCAWSKPGDAKGKCKTAPKPKTT